LFSVTCSEGFESVIGVEISADSVKYAKLNADTNKIANAKFLTGSADQIFEVVRTPPDHTALIIDPPRKVPPSLGKLMKKGCDEAFLNQLLKFNPRVVIYVSCNVYTQARDIAYILKEQGSRYKVIAIRGFDLFPHTHHVESIATLVRYQEFD
jgi:tRNA (uracil-5-)-methyltransferase